MKAFGTAAVLAGGKSSRMGFDKQLLTVNERRLYQLTIDSLKQQFDDVLFVTNTPLLFAGLPVRTCTDVFRDMGPLGGLHAALSQTRSRYLYLMACDMPCLCLPYIKHMQERLTETGAEACVTLKNGWVEPFNAFYSVDTLPLVQERLSAGRSSMFYYTKSVNTLVLPEEEARGFDPLLNMFLNLNTYDEYQQYLAGAGR